ncbi:acetylcholine receptor subunit alpha-like [Haliotis rubra]|uniref:acetylcholine receptor subunit alpha-like n=1 Tax=Haliotis rubra TaxID=36100 RepID=UPI001EE50F90|nr:acetylcholine receptor subunit alpha-like [Haliotis rubra]
MFLNVFVLLHALSMACGTDFSPLYKLHETVTKGYNPHIRPIKNPRLATNVTVDFTLFSVEEVNEASETLTSFGTFNITWYDEWFVWNISDHANIQKMYLPLHQVWKPDLVVANAVEDFRFLSDTEGLVSVSNTGFVTWYRTIRQITKCSMDMSRFPIDKQTCSLRISQWTSNSNNVFVQGGSVMSVMSDYTSFQSRGEWIERETGTKTKTLFLGETTWNVISFTFTFQRKPLHFVITSVLPVFLLSVLNLGVFLLPPESGEKISLCISVFLSYAVILTDINEDLPHSFDSLVTFKVYLLTMLLVKVITVLATVAILKRYHAEMSAHQLSSASSQEGLDGGNSVLDDCKGKYHERKMSADALNRVLYHYIGHIRTAPQGRRQRVNELIEEQGNVGAHSPKPRKCLEKDQTW